MNKEHVFAQTVLRNWPFQRGVGRLIRALGNPKFNEEVATVRTTDGVDLRVLPNDLIGRHIYLTGDYERSVLDVLYSLAKPGDVLLDIGANIGYVSASFLHKVPGSQVLAIEPQPGCVSELLDENLVHFPNRFQIFPVAMSDHSGRARFKVSGFNLGDGRIADDGEVEVAVEAGDDILRGVEKIDLIKIDVQGHELKALQSMKRTLERLRPRAIIFEDDDGQLHEIARFLKGSGYTTQAIQKTMLGFKIRDISADCDNYIAISAY